MGMRHPTRHLLTALLLGAAAGCRSPLAESHGPGRSIVADVILSVRNDSRATAAISLEVGDSGYSLGGVGSGSSRAFSLPAGVVGDEARDIRFAAKVDGTVIRSDALQIVPGRKLVLTIDASGRRATVTP